MNLSWFCAPYGVNRFELRMAGLPTPPNTNRFQLSGQLSYTGAPPASMVISNFDTNLTLSFYAYITPKSGPGFGNNGAQFTIPCNVELGKTYAVTVRALDKNGNGSPFSDVQTFVWRQTNAPTLTVPWPARPLPSTNANFTALAYFLSTNNPTPVFLTANFTGNGVLVGFSPYHPIVGATFVKSGIGGVLDPNSVLLTNSFGDSIFPCALYRYQAPNPNFPVVSGTVIQVSPLMENIAYQLSASQGVTNTVIADPFIAETFTLSNDGGIVWLWLTDTQPQISGARYRYILVRFKSNHEIDQLIPSTEVDVP